jgi:hypothetical protein
MRHKYMNIEIAKIIIIVEVGARSLRIPNIGKRYHTVVQNWSISSIFFGT